MRIPPARLKQSAFMPWITRFGEPSHQMRYKRKQFLYHWRRSLPLARTLIIRRTFEVWSNFRNDAVIGNNTDIPPLDNAQSRSHSNQKMKLFKGRLDQAHCSSRVNVSFSGVSKRVFFLVALLLALSRVLSPELLFHAHRNSWSWVKMCYVFVSRVLIDSHFPPMSGADEYFQITCAVLDFLCLSNWLVN